MGQSNGKIRREMSDDVYPGKRILVSIFSQTDTSAPGNKTFKKNLGEYKHLMEDVDLIRLKKTFPESKVLFRKKTWEIEEYIGKIKADDYDKFVFIFLTFKGDADGLIRTNDNNPYQVDKIFEKMTSLSGKPKLVLIQACDLSLIGEETSFPKGPKFKEVLIPSDIDRLVITSTIPQIVGNTKEEMTSFLIRAFCEVVEKNHELPEDQRESMNCLTTDILQKVSENIDKLSPDKAKNLEIPLEFSSLTKFMVI